MRVRFRVSRFASLGIGPGKTPSQDPKLSPVLAAAVPSAIARVRAANFFMHDVGGWMINTEVVDYRFKDPLVRASVNFGGPAFNLAQEALYFTAVNGSDGKPLTGENKYRITFPKGHLPPVDAFWSITLYGPGLHRPVVANPINRYCISDFTPGIRTTADGSLDIFIQHELPSQGTSNWLPAPAESFSLLLRAYQAHSSMIDGTYKMPLIRLV